MRKQSDASRPFTWVDNRKTKAELDVETTAKFDKDAQLKALMLQVKKLSEEAGIDLHPVFAEQVLVREQILETHNQEKSTL